MVTTSTTSVPAGLAAEGHEHVHGHSLMTALILRPGLFPEP